MLSKRNTRALVRAGALAFPLLLVMQSLSSPALADYPPRPGGGGGGTNQIQTAPLPPCVIKVPGKYESNSNTVPLQTPSSVEVPVFEKIQPKNSDLALIIPNIEKLTPVISKSLTTDCLPNKNRILQFNSWPKGTSTTSEVGSTFFFIQGKSNILHGYIYPPFSTVSFNYFNGDKSIRTFLGHAIVNSSGEFRAQLSSPSKIGSSGYLQVVSQDNEAKLTQILLPTQTVSSKSLKKVTKGKPAIFVSVKSSQK